MRRVKDGFFITMLSISMLSVTSITVGGAVSCVGILTNQKKILDKGVKISAIGLIPCFALESLLLYPIDKQVSIGIKDNLNEMLGFDICKRF